MIGNVFVVNAIIKNEENKFLLVKRANEGIHAGKWALPGGIVEQDESKEEALKREVFEETGLKVKKIIKQVASYDYLRPDGRLSNGYSFLVGVEDFNVKLNCELTDFEWIAIEELENFDCVGGIEEEILACI